MALFEDLTARLQQIDTDLGAAEAHGMLCGFICTDSVQEGGAWLESLTGDANSRGPSEQQAYDLLSQLYILSENQLGDIAFDFELLLPDDDAKLSERAEALTHWCHGFLVGLGLGGFEESMIEEQEVKEALQYFSAISQMDYIDIIGDEADEHDYMEIVEYVRMAVLMIYSELVQSNMDDEGTDNPSEKPLLH